MGIVSKTSIVATLGPASSDAAVLESLVRQGISVFRLNFSHGTLETHAQTLAHISRIRKSLPYEIAVLGDLCGPKIRLGQVEPQTVLEQNTEVLLSAGTAVGTAAQLFTDFEPLVRDVQPGQRILIDDGRLVLQAADKTAAGIRCRVLTGGPVSSRKGVNLPDTRLSIPPITAKDWQDADWAIENQLDYLALSFVQQPDEIIRLKEYLASKGSAIRVIAKIEKPLAVEHSEAIIRVSDAVLIARGDMGVEMDLAQVPLVQKKIAALCRRLAKPVIVATQVLQSMIDNASPTRAEAADIANAVMDGADALMLSGETAVGRYPLAAAAALSHICRTTERFLEASGGERASMETSPEQTEKAAVARAVAQMLDEIRCACIVVCTKTGQMAHLLSKAHPDVPVVSLSANRLLARQLALCRGVISIYQPAVSAYDDWIRLVERLLLANRWASAGDKVLLIPPLDLLTAQTSGALILHTLAA